MHLPARHLGLTAATMLLERINGDTQPTRTVVLRGVLHAADSTRRVIEVADVDSQPDESVPHQRFRR